MKYILPITSFCFALCTFNANAMFIFNNTTTEKLTTMLSDVIEVGTTNNLTTNPAFLVYKEMKSTIELGGFKKITDDETVNTHMKNIHVRYKNDENYKKALEEALELTRDHQNQSKIDAAWRAVLSATIKSITDHTEAHSSFKCPRTQNPDINKQYLDVLTLNQNAKSEDGPLWKACTAMTYYQMQERTELKEQTTKQD